MKLVKRCFRLDIAKGLVGKWYKSLLKIGGRFEGIEAGIAAFIALV